MYLLRKEKEEILIALEKEYRSIIKILFEVDQSPASEAELRDRLTSIKNAMVKLSK